MKKILSLLLSIILLTTFGLAYNYGETLFLPQFEATTQLDTEGVYRTYLYCTWHIDGIGEEAMFMDSQTCPAIAQDYTPSDNDGDLIYAVRIDSVGLMYSAGEWVILGTGTPEEWNVTYEIEGIPEPPQSIFESLYNTILNLVHEWLCNWFGIFC